MNKENAKAFRATIWSVFERLSNQIVGFVIGIVLARLLSPYDYGVVGLTAIFIAVSNVFVDSGFGNALIRKPDCSEEELSTAFYFNVAIGVVVYIKLPYEEIAHSLGNLEQRGVAIKNNQTLEDLYNERVPLYEKYADIVCEEKNMTISQTALFIRDKLMEYE